MILGFLVTILVTLASCTDGCRMAKGEYYSSRNEYSLDSVRESLVRQEDTILFGLIERARFPLNSPTYHQNYASIPDFCGSLLDFLVYHTETIQAKAGRYMNPEENPYTENLPSSVVPHYTFSQFLHPAASLVNINKHISETYINELLSLFVAAGDDGNYAQTAANDLSLLQNREALLKLLTSESVEEMVRKRVEKKSMVFGQEVSLDCNVNRKYKVDPLVISGLYQKWIIPLTKEVEVEYLLRRPD